MAEIDYMEDYGATARDSVLPDFGRWANISGAVVSLALIAGLSVWGYKLLMRDVTGVPVVQAMEGAFRIAPDDPGGMRAPHQGLAVNEIAAIGEAGGPVDQVRLAPPPVALTDEDRAAAALDLMAREESEPASVPQSADMVEAVTSETPVPDALDLPAVAGVVIEDTPPGARATDLAVAEALDTTQELVLTETAPVPSADPAGDRPSSPRPPARPARLAAVPDAPSPTLSQSVIESGAEIDVASLELGTRLVQLGAYPDDDIARAEWIKIAARFPDYFDGKRRVVQRASSGGKTFYRLRAEGFDDLADTRRFCTALVAGNADCIPVELR